MEGRKTKRGGPFTARMERGLDRECPTLSASAARHHDVQRLGCAKDRDRDSVANAHRDLGEGGRCTTRASGGVQGKGPRGGAVRVARAVDRDRNGDEGPSVGQTSAAGDGAGHLHAYTMRISRFAAAKRKPGRARWGGQQSQRTGIWRRQYVPPAACTGSPHTR